MVKDKENEETESPTKPARKRRKAAARKTRSKQLRQRAVEKLKRAVSSTAHRVRGSIRKLFKRGRG